MSDSPDLVAALWVGFPAELPDDQSGRPRLLVPGETVVSMPLDEAYASPFWQIVDKADAEKAEEHLHEVELDQAGALLTGDALKARAAELDIDGRSQMTADELREAILDHETAPEPLLHDAPTPDGEDS